MESYELPLFPLNTVLFPGQTLPLHIFEPRYREMIRDCMRAGRIFGVVLIREGMEVGGPAEPHRVGTVTAIQDIEYLPDGRMHIVAQGRERFRLQDWNSEIKPYLIGRVSPWPWDDDPPPSTALSQIVQRRVARYIDLLVRASDLDVEIDQMPQDPASLAVLASAALQISSEQKQTLLEVPSLAELLRRLKDLLQEESRALSILLASLTLHQQMEGPFSRN